MSDSAVTTALSRPSPPLASPDETQPQQATAIVAGVVAMACVGGSAAVSSALVGAPVFTAQAVRYAVACLLLLWAARAARRQILLPRGAEWLWLMGIAMVGLVVFNVALVCGARHAEPAALGVAVACPPVLLAVIGPLMRGRRPSPRVLAAASVVTCGAVIVQGLGRCDAQGVAWAVTVFACETGFTILAVPILDRHGPWGVSVHTTWLATVVFAVLGVCREGPSALTRLSVHQALATAYLAVAVTAVAFVLWYSCVNRIGADRAGLLAGVAPVAASAAGVALGGRLPAIPVWIGVMTVAAGLVVGLGSTRSTHG